MVQDPQHAASKSPTNSPFLLVDKLCVRFAERAFVFGPRHSENHTRKHAVKDVSFNLNRGETLGLVG